ncbi:DUF4238 domain-containing protein [Persicimonas caeni]|uniref:DUF4238 domain-containing protein n=1 Tax=Persicimonas caeni TaxID=2292766 RepID=A0A4Y6Q0I7_PERCE|nr:DUF4238 domain-containing protein [Persicimonas caeni]QDG54084.1 DUF4238 domain-containing protein [Persicimonas caeni]QED35305.1 DUF4238 domain-containing protein [Persicimonas caeni]
MPPKKKQHWVPQFYLRQFSADSKSVSLALVDQERFIPTASIPGQCYQDYFYGKTCEVEDRLHEIETEIAPLIHEICSTRRLPSRGSNDDALLRRYMWVQHGRTLEAAENTEAMQEQTVEEVSRFGEIRGPLAEQLQPSTDNPVLYPLSASLKNYVYLLDLDAALIANATESEFMTSDQPVVRYNKYCEAPHSAGRGLIRKGLMVFFPLTPRLTLFLFDSEIYKVERSDGARITLRKSGDLRQLNRLQWINATNVVIVGPQTSKGAALQYAEQARLDRPVKSMSVQSLFHAGSERFISEDEAKQRGFELPRRRQLLMHYDTFPSIDLDLSFVRMRMKALRGGKRMEERMRERRAAWLEA